MVVYRLLDEVFFERLEVGDRKAIAKQYGEVT
jgi:hypothetical protein